MSRRLMRIVTAAGIFIGVILVMSVAAKILMAQESKEAESAAETVAQNSEDAQNEDKSDETENNSDITDSSQNTENLQSGENDSESQAEGQTAGKDDLAEGSGNEAAGSGTEQGQKADTEPENDASDSESVRNEGSHIVVINAAHQKTKLSGEEPIGPGASKNKIKISYGATGVATDIPEYELTLAVAKLLKDELISRGYSVVMIREENDFSMSDAERARLANDSGEAVIHIHGNADEREGIAGIMAFYPSADNSYASSYSSSSKALCSAVLAGMEKTTSAKNWGPIANDNLSELNWTKIPAAHVEIGYLSNRDEDKKLKENEYRMKIVKGIADGLDSYFNQ